MQTERICAVLVFAAVLSAATWFQHSALLGELKIKSVEFQGDSLYLLPPMLGRPSVPIAGVPIDTAFFGPLQQVYLETWNWFPLSPEYASVFATYRIKLCDGYEAYLLRYDSGIGPVLLSVDLFVVHVGEERLRPPVTVAWSFGDAGWFVDQAGWLLDVNGDECLDLVRRRKDFEEDVDQAGRGFERLTDDSLTVLLWSQGSYSAPDLIADSAWLRRFDFK